MDVTGKKIAAETLGGKIAKVEEELRAGREPRESANLRGWKHLKGLMDKEIAEEIRAESTPARLTLDVLVSRMLGASHRLREKAKISDAEAYASLTRSETVGARRHEDRAETVRAIDEVLTWLLYGQPAEPIETFDESKLPLRADAGITPSDFEQWLAARACPPQTHPDGPVDVPTRVHEAARRGAFLDALREYRRMQAEPPSKPGDLPRDGLQELTRQLREQAGAMLFVSRSVLAAVAAQRAMLRDAAETAAPRPGGPNGLEPVPEPDACSWLGCEMFPLGSTMLCLAHWRAQARTELQAVERATSHVERQNLLRLALLCAERGTIATRDDIGRRSGLHETELDAFLRGDRLKKEDAERLGRVLLEVVS